LAGYDWVRAAVSVRRAILLWYRLSANGLPSRCVPHGTGAYVVFAPEIHARHPLTELRSSEFGTRWFWAWLYRLSCPETQLGEPFWGDLDALLLRCFGVTCIGHLQIALTAAPRPSHRARTAALIMG